MSDDLIKRADAIKHLKRWFHSKGWMVSDEDCKSILWDIPSADRPQGKWLDTGKDPSHSHPLTAIWYRCSECGDGTNTKTNFCPNCGARMKGADDETDKSQSE